MTNMCMFSGKVYVTFQELFVLLHYQVNFIKSFN